MIHDDSTVIGGSAGGFTPSFGANPIALQGAAVLSDISTSSLLSGTYIGKLCQGLADSLSGANVTGMDVIKSCVSDLSSFWGVDNVKVCFEMGEPGVHFRGFTDSATDNWIGGDPAVLQQYANQYGPNFIQNVMAHEMGHFVFDQLGLINEGYPTISNEAVADFLSGIYSGSKGLDPAGTVAFYSSLPDDPNGDYPSGEERAELFMEGYEIANRYPWKDFESILDSLDFNLRDSVHEIADRFVQS